MFMIFILIQIEIDIEINIDELLENIWEHKKREKKKLIVIAGVQQHEAQIS
jgi:anti-sigma regulatory factor (Ser/Thr protein kinase)